MASPPRETEPGARPQAPRAEHKAGPCPSPTSNQHRPSSMRFNCLFIILAHRGYKEAWHFCARHPAEPWELSRLKKTTARTKGPVLNWMASGARASVRGPGRRAWQPLAVCCALSDSIWTERRVPQRDENLNSQPPSAPMSLFCLIVYLKCLESQ